MDNYKQKESVMKLINAHKLSMILIPLIEAVEINKRSGNIDGLKVSDLLSHVIDVGTDIYQKLLSENNETAIVESGAVADKLYITLAKALRNSIVLYNTPSLSLMRDEVESLFQVHQNFMSKYQTETSVQVNKSAEREISKLTAESIEHTTSSLTQMFMPFWLFHTNLYTSGIIGDVKLVELNQKATGYMIKVIDKLMEKMSRNHGSYNENFKISSLFICSEMTSNVVYDFHGKLIKNKKMLNAYIESPESVLSRLVPAILASFGVLTSCIDDTISSMMNN